ncbi:MAG: cupin domain-containing protein [Cyanobacteria bacterium J06623_4]
MPISLYPLKSQCVQSVSGDHPAVRVRTWQGEKVLLSDCGTHYGFVWQGTASLRRKLSLAPFPLTAGMYFSVAEASTLDGSLSSGMVVTYENFSQGHFLVGGPMATQGQFAYIDGGTTSLLIAPMTVGDPCLNALYMPPNVDQTVHHHPSDRIGIVVQGIGDCFADGEGYALTPGTVFHIPAHQKHRFCTYDQALHLVVFHPDSDMGFSDRNHPMLRRTLVNNVSAANLPDIQTTV